MFSDINECENNQNQCHENATCSNRDGNYTCSCNDGFMGDGFTCSGTRKFSLQITNVQNSIHS